MALSKIYVEDHKRPCFVVRDDGSKLKAIFHRWSDISEIYAPSPLEGGHPGGVVKGTLAIVELESGQVGTASPEKITFIDGGDFDEYCWGDE